MAHSFTFAVLSLMFFSTASAAPAGHQESCIDVQTSSLELNKIARNVSLEVSCLIFFFSKQFLNFSFLTTSGGENKLFTAHLECVLLTQMHA